MKCGGAMKMKTGGQTIVGMPGYNATTRPMTMKKGGTKLKKAQTGTIVNRGAYDPNTGMNPSSTPGSGMMKKGGAAKNAKLAAVAPPRNKVTRADVLTRILKKKKK
jgi:hypothetical protein